MQALSCVCLRLFCSLSDYLQESVFFAAEALTVLQWGRISDRIGRKPPLVFGTLGLAAAITSFGLTKKFWPLIVSRCVQGIFNGNIGITKAVMGEMTDASNAAQGTFEKICR